MSSNPLSIIPDYRTKVLAQFGDRASEVPSDLYLRRRVVGGGCCLVFHFPIKHNVKGESLIP